MARNSVSWRYRKYFLMLPARDDSGFCIKGGVHGFTIQEQWVMNREGTFLLSRWDSDGHATTVSTPGLEIDIPAAMSHFHAHGYDRTSRAQQRVAYLVLYQGYDCVGMEYSRSPVVHTPNPINELLDRVRDIAGIGLENR